MQIRTFLKESFIDYPNKISSVVFVPGCNYKCPACHVKHLLEKGENIDERELFNYLNSRKGWIEGIVISGGEPTSQFGLVDFTKKCKDLGLFVKLDTNGTGWATLGELLKEKTVDYVAMDIKGPPNLYRKIVGKDIDLRDDVEKGIMTVQNFPDYEFRTTVVPIIEDDSAIRWITADEMKKMAEWIKGFTWRKEPRYYLQHFVPRKGELLDSRLEDFPQTPEELMQESLKAVKEILPNCRIR